LSREWSRWRPIRSMRPLRPGVLRQPWRATRDSPPDAPALRGCGAPRFLSSIRVPTWSFVAQASPSSWKATERFDFSRANHRDVPRSPHAVVWRHYPRFADGVRVRSAATDDVEPGEGDGTAHRESDEG